MKKIILSISIAAIFAACGNPEKTDVTAAANGASTVDTAGLSEYKQWKEQQNVVSMEGMNELNNENNITPDNTIQKSAPVVIYREPARRNTVSSAPKSARTSRQRAVVKAPEPVYEPEETIGGTSSGPTVATQPTVSSGPVISDEPVATVPETKEEKKGWSKAAKGTAIGAGSGAVLGAIISKKKGAGAIIGGVVGAAGGYVLGRAQDKKDGRY